MRTVLAILITTLALPAHAATIHVPDDQPTIQAGIDAASAGDTVLVACGTYYEHDIVMASGVTLCGVSSEPDSVIIDAEQLSHGFVCLGCAPGTSIEWITIQHGAVEFGNGGGALIEGGEIAFRHCRFLDNGHYLHQDGAGIYLSDATLTLEDCLFAGNFTNQGDCGILLASGTPEVPVSVSVRRCVFRDNRDNYFNFRVRNGTLSLEDCEFSENSSTGGNIFCTGARMDITRCHFLANENGVGPVVGCWSLEAAVADCRFIGNVCVDYGSPGALTFAETVNTVAVERCLFAENVAQGTSVLITLASHCTLRNCTLARNTYYDPCSVYNSILKTYGDLVIDACVIVFNTSLTGDGQPVWVFDGGSLDVACTDVYGNQYGDWVGYLAPFENVAGNFSLNPHFCGMMSHDFTVNADSPCLPGNNECGVLAGAYGMGCGETATSAPPAVCELAQNYPNPFNPTTEIRFTLPEAATVHLEIYDLSGRLVRGLVTSHPYQTGSHTVTWNGKNDSGQPMPSGVYFYRIEADDYVETRKMTLLR